MKVVHLACMGFAHSLLRRRIIAGVPAAQQKLLAKTAWAGILKDSANLAQAKLTPGTAITLIGTASTMAAPAERVVFVEDMATEEQTRLGSVLPAGLSNAGNTCYLNSTLQCLRAVPELSDAARELVSSAPGGAGAGAGTGVATEFGRLLDDLDRSTGPVVPGRFLRALRAAYPVFDERQGLVHKQQDSDEFQSNVMEELAQALVAPARSLPRLDPVDAGGRSRTNVLDTLFGIEFRTTLHCAETDAETDTTQVESSRKLICNIQGGAGSTVQINHMHEGIRLGLEGDIEKRSAVLGRDAVWHKTSRIRRLPRYLCVQFMRFFWKSRVAEREGEPAGMKSKILRPVAFPADSFDVFELCDKPLQDILARNRAVRREAEDAARDAKAAAASTASSSDSSSSSAPAAAADGSASHAKRARGSGGDDDADGDASMTVTPAAPATTADDDDEAELARALAMSMDSAAAAASSSSSSASESSGAASSSIGLGSGIPADFEGQYELFAVVTHKGRDADSGHYMGWVRRSGDEWLNFDDDVVTPCKTEHVLALKGGGDHDMAYILFYRAAR